MQNSGKNARKSMKNVCIATRPFRNRVNYVVPFQTSVEFIISQLTYKQNKSYKHQPVPTDIPMVLTGLAFKPLS